VNLEDAATRAACQKQYEELVSILRMLGFLSNEEKNELPTQRLTFLGAGLDSNTEGSGNCSKYIAEDKRARVQQECSRMASSPGRVRVSAIMTLLGRLTFCAGVVLGTRIYLRSGFDLIRGKERHEFVQLTREFRLDMKFLARVYTVTDPRTMLVKRQVTTAFGSWDASTSWGMGGFLDGRWFSESWEEFLRQRHTLPGFYPRKGTPTFHINYLELFAGYWFIRSWGELLRGQEVVCHTDNTVTEAMLKKLWGTGTFIPLLKEIQILLVQYDISLRPCHITSKDNILADCLSRGAMGEFHSALEDWSNVHVLDKDLEDWQICPDEVQSLDEEFGPFDVDACTDIHRSNAHFGKSWNQAEDCLKQRWQGLNVFCNGPFSILEAIFQHALECKRDQPLGTAALLIAPCWPTAAFYKLAMAHPSLFQVVLRWEKGTPLFTATMPAAMGGGRIYNGPTQWPVVALRMPPGAL
jgi:hypothetical protein